MAAGDVKQIFIASSALTQTSLDALVSSTTWVAGWESGAIDNSAGNTDYAIGVKIQAESAGLTAGEIRVYIVAEQDDSTWPDVFDGTESTETITSVEIRDAICFLIAACRTTTTASRTYYLSCPSLAAKIGAIPRKFVIFIAHSMVAATESTGDPNQVYVRATHLNIAA